MQPDRGRLMSAPSLNGPQSLPELEKGPSLTYRPSGDFGLAGSEYHYGTDPYDNPLAHKDDNWYEELADASGLDTWPDTGLVPPSTVAMEEETSFAMVVRRAAAVLDLQLPSVEVKMNVLMEVLQPGVLHSEPLLPFKEGL